MQCGKGTFLSSSLLCFITTIWTPSFSVGWNFGGFRSAQFSDSFAAEFSLLIPIWENFDRVILNIRNNWNCDFITASFVIILGQIEDFYKIFILIFTNLLKKCLWKPQFQFKNESSLASPQLLDNSGLMLQTGTPWSDVWLPRSRGSRTADHSEHENALKIFWKRQLINSLWSFVCTAARRDFGHLASDRSSGLKH